MANHDSNSFTPLSDRFVIDNRLSRYYLHHSDNPGLVLVKQQLTGDNYASWSRAMQIALLVNKIGFIDGSIARPDDTDPHVLSSWIRNNNVVISWILNSVSKDILANIIFSERASEIWLDLKDRFQQSNGPRIFQLRQDLINLVQNQDSISIHFTKLKTLWDELSKFRPSCNCGKSTCGGVKEPNSYFIWNMLWHFLWGYMNPCSY